MSEIPDFKMKNKVFDTESFTDLGLCEDSICMLFSSMYCGEKHRHVYLIKYC